MIELKKFQRKNTKEQKRKGLAYFFGVKLFCCLLVSLVSAQNFSIVSETKTVEIGIEFFMQMAYDAEKWNVSNQNQFLRTWAKREFGAKDSAEIASLMDKYFRLGFGRKPEHLQFYLPKETPRKSDFTDAERRQRIEDYKDITRRAEQIYQSFSAEKKDAFYELVLYPIRAAYLANERFFAAEIAENLKANNSLEAIEWARRSVKANQEIEGETKYFNEKLANGKWRFIMSPEMNEGQWTSMRAVPPKIDLRDFENLNSTTKDLSKVAETKEIISIEAENFTGKSDKNGFGWHKIIGLGKTGDSVTVFPQTAKTFSKGAPGLEYKFHVSKSLEFEADFYLVPTQPLVPNNGLRFAFAIDNEIPQIISVDKDAEVSGVKWAYNILNQTTVANTKIKLEKGAHILQIFAVDTGVVLDKIVLSEGILPKSYFAPKENVLK